MWCFHFLLNFNYDFTERVHELHQSEEDEKWFKRKYSRNDRSAWKHTWNTRRAMKKCVWKRERARARGTKKANEWKEHAFNEHFRVLNFLYRSFESGRQFLRALVRHSVAMACSFSLRSASVSLSFVSPSLHQPMLYFSNLLLFHDETLR